ncbi:MAG: OmpA family protein [Deltaproteobacteria bacterium]|nr:OmpA family protein [Deltaproteobacteria bacterium]
MQVIRKTQIGLMAAVLSTAGCASLSPVGELADRAPIDAQPITLEGNEVRVTDHVVVITDGSGTQYMNQTFPEAKALTRSFVKAMPAADVRAPESSSGYNAGAVGFGGEERNSVTVRPFDRAALAAQADSLKVMGAIDGMGGTTPLHYVIGELTGGMVGLQGRAALVVFSDGLPDDPDAALASAKTLVETRADDTCIHAVQTGDSADGQAFLKRLTGLTNCGSLRSGADLTSNFEVQQLAKAVFVGPGTEPVAAGPCDGVVRLRGIEFAFDRAEIVSSSKPVLDAAAHQLQQCPNIRVNISGHTDSSGSESYNNGLSYRRAESTKSYFVSQGVDVSRLEAEGHGESQPVAENDTRDGRARNRRVELAPIR